MFSIVGFQARNWRYSQENKKDVLISLPVSCTHCDIGTENYADAVLYLF